MKDNISKSGLNRTAAKMNIPVSDLRSMLNGRVITPEDTGYDGARTLFYGGIDRRPAVIVRPVNASEVANLVNLARDTGIELAIRSGGHSIAGHSLSDGGLVIDLKEMRNLQIDAPDHTAWVETGLTAGEVTKATGNHGLAIGFGDTGSVGIGGITLGGGIGFLVRKHGLTIDNLLAAEMVTADGQILHVDANSHPDLFWAIRGGGGNFGVATCFKFQLHRLGPVLGGMLFLPATPEVIAGFMEEAEAAPEELSTIANIMPAPPMPFVPSELVGQMILMAMVVYAGDPAEGERVMAPFRKLATPLADMLRPMAYAEMFEPEEGDYHPMAVGRTLFVDRIGQSEASTIIESLQSSDAAMRVAQIRVLGGAMARVPVDATAFAHRRSRILMSLAAFYTGLEDKAKQDAWVSGFADALDQGDSGVYVNFLGEEGSTRLRDAYPGSIWKRLTDIKRRYDPTNLFHLNHNIPPASERLGR